MDDAPTLCSVAPTLCSVLALYLIVAWRLLFVTHLGRVAPDAPAGQVVEGWRLAMAAIRLEKM